MEQAPDFTELFKKYPSLKKVVETGVEVGTSFSTYSSVLPAAANRSLAHIVTRWPRGRAPFLYLIPPKYRTYQRQPR